MIQTPNQCKCINFYNVLNRIFFFFEFSSACESIKPARINLSQSKLEFDAAHATSAVSEPDLNLQRFFVLVSTECVVTSLPAYT